MEFQSDDDEAWKEGKKAMMTPLVLLTNRVGPRLKRYPAHKTLIRIIHSLTYLGKERPTRSYTVHHFSDWLRVSPVRLSALRQLLFI